MTHFQWQDESANMKKIAGKLLILAVLLVLLGFFFASMAAFSDANSLGIAMAAFIIFWGPAALMVLVASVLFIVSKIPNAAPQTEVEYAHQSPIGQSQLESLDTADMLICKRCKREMFYDTLECVWCGEKISEAPLPTLHTIP